MASRTYLPHLQTELLEFICDNLEPEDLASLSFQSKCFYELAMSSNAWQRACKKRWPDCPSELYNGDYRAMYRTRAMLPQDFLLQTDQFSHVCESAMSHSTISSMVGAARVAFLVCLRVSCMPVLRRTREYKAFRRQLLHLMDSTPTMVVSWIRAVHAQAIDLDGDSTSWPHFSWLRSSMQFMLEVAAASGGGGVGSVNLSVVRRMERELCHFDYTLLDLRAELGGLQGEWNVPEGIQESHWWFFADINPAAAPAPLALAHL